MIDIARSYLRIKDFDNGLKWFNEILLKDPENIIANQFLKVLQKSK
ncbi:MAG: hypothetical protein Q8900_02785 [Bacillota bacterium]|nr:hypothetical protein [Bacillota bacterium]